ncbi:MAG: hypothetical protein Q7J64_02880 [Elusimicrobiota bacterium]|nr:hypothetical protein [Elusimicrobiota bacterium]
MKMASGVAVVAVFLSALSAQGQVLTRAQMTVAPVPVLAAPPLSLSGPSSVLSLSAPTLSASLTPVAPLAALVPAAPIAAASAPDKPQPLVQLRGVLTDWLKPGVVAEDGTDAGSIAAYVLDLDGNAFGPGFPTKIVLFRKGGDAELLVPTAHFAVIEKSIGKDFAYGGENLKNYELRGDASFRDFFGPQFAADLKYAVENLPAAEWQGPSWGAMVRALNDARIAPHVYVLTARQHSSEQLLDGFKYLQSAGYIRWLPKVENLHGVGGTRRTAERKAELMAEFVDALQASPLGADGARHAIGFSDDTWANYEKMRDTLAATLRSEPGRWDKVKIVLFFTGTNDLAHKPVSVVLNADGTTRPHIPGEPR